MEIKVLNLKNEEVGKEKLVESVWNVEFKESVIQKYVRVYLNNIRKFTAKVKDRAEVSGGGRKPWAQKGTGRARHGSTRSPIWRKGGVAHGPVPGKRLMKMNTKEKRLFYRILLSEFLREKLIKVYKEDEIKAFDLNLKSDKGLTKKVLKDFIKDKEKNIYVITVNSYKNIRNGINNLEKVSYKVLNGVNWFELSKSSEVILTDEVVKYFNDKLEIKKND